MLGVDYEYPSVYGLSQCDAFDAGLPPQCSTLDAGGSFDPLANPAFCSDSWCYVDVSNCNVASYVSVYITRPTPTTPIYYSYAACGQANRFNTYWTARQPEPPPPAHFHFL